MPWKQWAWPLATAALLLWLMSARFALPAAAMDEGMLLVYPEQILKGNLPYRDFDTAYGPANPYLLAGVFAGLGSSIAAERAVGLGFRLAILAAVGALAWRWGAQAAAGALLLTGIFLLPTNLVAYAWMGGMACALWSVWLAGRGGSVWGKWGAGLLAASALLFRPDLGPAVLLAAGVLGFAMPARERKYFAAGAVCGLMPLGLLALAVGPAQLYENLFHFPVLHSGRRVPIVADWRLSLLGLHFASCLVAIAAGTLALRADRRDARARLLVALGLCALGCSHQALQRFDAIHLFYSCILSLGILPLALLTALERRDGTSPVRPLLAVAVALLLAAVASPPMVGWLRQAVGYRTGGVLATAPFLHWNGRAYPMRSTREIARVTSCLDAVQRRAAPGERLFVGPRDLRHPHYADTFLYHLLPQLTPATYFLEMNPGSVDRPDSQLTTDLASAEWLILNRSWDAPTAAAEHPAAPEEIVRTQFALVHEVEGLEVYRKTTRVAGLPVPQLERVRDLSSERDGCGCGATATERDRTQTRPAIAGRDGQLRAHDPAQRGIQPRWEQAQVAARPHIAAPRESPRDRRGEDAGEVIVQVHDLEFRHRGEGRAQGLE